MPISAQEWRVRTGMNNAGKGAWLSSRKTSHTHQYPTSGHTGKETKLEEARNIHGVWLVAMVTLVIPLLYRVCTMMLMVLEVLLHVGLRGGGGSKLIVMNTYNQYIKILVVRPCVCVCVTDVGVAVTNLRVVCKNITCVSAFTFTEIKLEIVKAAADRDTLGSGCRLREGCHCERLPSY